MIDTVFNLLFFFMIISRFGAIEGMLPAKLPTRGSPSAAAAALPPRTPIRIRLQTDANRPGECLVSIDHFGESGVAMAQLAGTLEEIRNQAGFDSNTPVYLFAGDTVAWGHVVNAYNAALAARYEKIFFAGAP